jgi:hypothetical protein
MGSGLSQEEKRTNDLMNEYEKCMNAVRNVGRDEEICKDILRSGNSKQEQITSPGFYDNYDYRSPDMMRNEAILDAKRRAFNEKYEDYLKYGGDGSEGKETISLSATYTLELNYTNDIVNSVTINDEIISDAALKDVESLFKYYQPNTSINLTKNIQLVVSGNGGITINGEILHEGTIPNVKKLFTNYVSKRKSAQQATPDEAASTKVGGSSNVTKFILGKHRIVRKDNRKEYIMYNGKRMFVSDARIKERQIKNKK